MYTYVYEESIDGTVSNSTLEYLPLHEVAKRVGRLSEEEYKGETAFEWYVSMFPLVYDRETDEFVGRGFARLKCIRDTVTRTIRLFNEDDELCNPEDAFASATY